MINVQLLANSHQYASMPIIAAKSQWKEVPVYFYWSCFLRSDAILSINAYFRSEGCRNAAVATIVCVFVKWELLVFYWARRHFYN